MNALQVILVMELWFVLALLCAFLWGFSDIFFKLSTPQLGVTRIAVLIPLVESVMYFTGFYSWHQDVIIDTGYGALAAASSLAGIVAYLCFFESIMAGQIAIAGTISAAYPALTVVGAMVLLHETLLSVQLVGLLAVIGGIVALSHEPDPGSQHATPRRSLLFALVAFALWGFWSFTSKIVVSKIGPGNVLGFYVVSSSVVPLVYVWFRSVRPRPMNCEKPPWTAWGYGATGLAVNVIGTFAFSFALNAGYASLVVPISSSYPVVTVILAVTLLHEKLNRSQTVALVLTLSGLIMIGTTP